MQRKQRSGVSLGHLEGFQVIVRGAGSSGGVVAGRPDAADGLSVPLEVDAPAGLWAAVAGLSRRFPTPRPPVYPVLGRGGMPGLDGSEPVRVERTRACAKELVS